MKTSILCLLVSLSLFLLNGCGSDPDQLGGSVGPGGTQTLIDGVPGTGGSGDADDNPTDSVSDEISGGGTGDSDSGVSDQGCDQGDSVECEDDDISLEELEDMDEDELEEIKPELCEKLQAKKNKKSGKYPPGVQKKVDFLECP